MKKVLFVATVVKHHIISFHIPYLEWFKQKGYETHVCARNDYENKEECIIPYCDKYYDLPFGRSPLNLNNITSFTQLKKIIDTNEYDIIHCHTPVGGALTRLATKKARNNGTKVIYTAHGFHFFKGAPLKNWLFYYPIEYWLAKYTDVLITINKEDYTSAKNFKAKKIEYVPGVGIVKCKFEDNDVDLIKKREELGITEGIVALLSVGELSKRKNHEVIIKALAKINNPNIIYFICGCGELEEYLINLSKKIGVKEQVKFLGFRKDISEICKAVDVFVFPSKQEGLPVALMEAMAAGLPIICSNIRGNIDLIENNKGGYLIEPESIIDFANAITKVTNDNRLRANMKIYNTQNIKIFDIKNVKEKMGRIYTSLGK